MEDRTDGDGEPISFTPQKWWHRLWRRKQSSKPKTADKFGWIKGVLVSNICYCSVLQFETCGVLGSLYAKYLGRDAIYSLELGSGTGRDWLVSLSPTIYDYTAVCMV